MYWKINSGYYGYLITVMSHIFARNFVKITYLFTNEVTTLRY